MAINTAAKKRVLAAERKGPQSSTHFPNAETFDGETESGYEVRNQLDPQDLLYDPEEEGGNAHFANDGTPGSSGVVKSVKASTQKPVKKAPASANVLAGVKSNAAKRILAAEFNVDEDEASGFTQDGVDTEGAGDFGADEFGGPVEAGADADEGPQATTHFPNGEDDGADDEATMGYLTIGDLTEMGPDSDAVSIPPGGGGLDEEGGDEEFVGADFEDEDEIDPAELEDDAGQNPQQSLLDVTDEHEVDAEFDDFAEPQGEPNEVEDEALGLDNMEMANVDDMNLMDVDGADDSAENMTTAAMGTVLHVIKANRIVASMTKKMAIKAGHGDHYLGDEFHEATMAECSTYGVRAGLKSMGFALAKVNVGRSDVLNKRVESRTKQVTASIKRSNAASNEALGQCLAIAAVGINRQYFKDTRNELRAALEVELGSAGVRNASKLVRRVFASHGVDYAKAILTLANRLVGMPEETRNAFASALDMTSEGDFDADSGIEAPGDEMEGDFQAEAGDEFGETDGMDDGFVDEFEDEEAAPETIHAALAQGAWRPTRQQSRVSASQAGYSVTAQAILNGTAKFPLGAF